MRARFDHAQGGDETLADHACGQAVDGRIESAAMGSQVNTAMGHPWSFVMFSGFDTGWRAEGPGILGGGVLVEEIDLGRVRARNQTEAAGRRPMPYRLPARWPRDLLRVTKAARWRCGTTVAGKQASTLTLRA